MKSLLPLCLVFFLGCADGLNGGTSPAGPKGDPGAAGPAGPQGPVGPAGASSGPHLVTVDRAGKQVGIDVGGVVVDSAGLLWSVSGETDPVVVTVSVQMELFESLDCTGSGRPFLIAPRIPFRLPGDVAGYRVRPDNSRIAQAMIVRSIRVPDGSCTSFGATGIQYPSIDLPPLQTISPPVLNFRGPFHQELR